MLRQKVGRLVEEAVREMRRAGSLTAASEAVAPVVGRARSEEHGDFTTNFALAAAKAEGKPPREIASLLARFLSGHADIESAEAAGPGFVNIRMRPAAWVDGLDAPIAAGDRWGRRAPGEAGGERILVEFVSANPTGPLHVGHGRGAVLGDSLVRCLRAAGHDAAAEYYWNDRGRQVAELGRSISIRVRESAGRLQAPPEDGNWYRGDYVRDLAPLLASAPTFAPEVARSPGDPAAALADLPESDPRFAAFGVEKMKSRIAATLERLRVRFDVMSSESDVAGPGDAAIRALAERLVRDGNAEERDGALFLRTAGREKDDKDRVFRKSGGEWTYFATDLLYHDGKFRRGFERLINIWGADHHGYIARMRAGLGALGRPPQALEILLVQMVNLTAGGKPVRMSKRSGDFVTLDELIDDVGVDAARYVFLTRRHDSQLEFDVELVKKRSLDNPVFYAQYGHARLASILRRAAALPADPRVPEGARTAVAAALGIGEGPTPPPEALGLAAEIALARLVLSFPDVVTEAAETREPHRIVYYIQELSQAFQSYYTERWKRHGDPVLPPARLDAAGLAAWDWTRTAARLRWIRAIRCAVASALGIVGVEAPDRMEWSDEAVEAVD